MSVQPTYSPPITDEELAKIANRTINDFVEHAPGTMTVFSMYGLDTCCGGGLPLGEALAKHGIEADPVLREVAVIIAESQDW
jgi:iron-sulfur cluster repair protein YtfE (RIC family)